MPAYPLDPPLECDVVMKGGITSGVIYPEAVCELARTYRLRSVGGASAGTIAAAAAAAAEVGRATGGFEALERLPHDITAATPGGRSVLFRLFQPIRASAPLFRAATAGMGYRGPRRVLRTLGAVLGAFWLPLLLGALPGGYLLVTTAAGDDPQRWAGIVAAVVVGLVGAVVGLLLRVAWIFRGPLPRSGYGFCSGMPGKGRRRGEALTPWMHRHLQTMAGRGEGAAPLTFGDLADAGVTLRTMTTNLTRHQPLAMPWGDAGYFFDPAEMRRLFPEDVVRWLESHPPVAGSGPAEQRRAALLRRQALPLLPLPDGPDLPVLVATRMSLSFPVLITAVPLHAVDYSAPVNRESAAAARAWLTAHPDAPLEEADGVVAAPRFGVNWFSDGGICSNLPVHFFDSPLPSRPTFAVNLAPFPEGREKDRDEARNSYLPTTDLGGARLPWYRLPRAGFGAVPSFLMAVVATARGWVDAGQLVMPGYRDRVVTIWHDYGEGGMNLAMPPDVVASLAARGREGAAKIVAHFAGEEPGDEPAPGWENQRWIRLRTAAAGTDGWLRALRAGYRAPSPGATPYRALAGPGAAAGMPSFAVPSGLRPVVNDRVGSLLDLTTVWSAHPADAMTDGAPTPRPRIRLVPDDGTAAGLADAGGVPTHED